MRTQVYLSAGITNKNSLQYNYIMIMPEKTGICKGLSLRGGIFFGMSTIDKEKTRDYNGVVF